MIKEGCAGFDTVSHLNAIIQTAQKIVDKTGLNPDIEGRVQWMPLPSYELFGAAI
jgi:hypothetical protein